ncbi:MAG: hypothetical protein SF069_16445 [Phycisphaerae bacterium]|nr:hypothetical protein [Phycisphaerae bacterium]
MKALLIRIGFVLLAGLAPLSAVAGDPDSFDDEDFEDDEMPQFVQPPLPPLPNSPNRPAAGPAPMPSWNGPQAGNGGWQNPQSAPAWNGPAPQQIGSAGFPQAGSSQPGFPQQGFAASGAMNTPHGPQLKPGAPLGAIDFERHDGGFFRIMKPRGWQVSTFGNGPTLSYCIKDPGNPARQFFMIAQCTLLGSENAKQLFMMSQQYSAQPVDVSDAPVTPDMSPQGFLRSWNSIARTRAVQQAMPWRPELANLQVVGAQPQPSPFDQVGARGEQMRATFTEAGMPAEGLFFAAVSRYDFMEQGCAMSFTGVTAPQGELATLQPIAQRCLESLQLDPGYVQTQRQLQQANFRDAQMVRNTMNEINDIHNRTWQDRQESIDLRHRMWSDGMSGVERMVDPNSGQTYWVNNGDYRNYDMNRNQFEMNNLQSIPYDRRHLEMLNRNAWNGYENIR